MIPQLRKFIDDINSRYRKTVKFTYLDKHTATLTVTADSVTVSTTNPTLNQKLGQLLERVLQGDMKGIDNK